MPSKSEFIGSLSGSPDIPQKGIIRLGDVALPIDLDRVPKTEIYHVMYAGAPIGVVAMFSRTGGRVLSGRIENVAVVIAPDPTAPDVWLIFARPDASSRMATLAPVRVEAPKTCRACRTIYERPSEAFHRLKRSKDGYYHDCKACVKARDKAIREGKRGETDHE